MGKSRSNYLDIFQIMWKPITTLRIPFATSSYLRRCFGEKQSVGSQGHARREKLPPRILFTKDVGDEGARKIYCPMHKFKLHLPRIPLGTYIKYPLELFVVEFRLGTRS